MGDRKARKDTAMHDNHETCDQPDALTEEVLARLSAGGHSLTAQRRALIGLILARDRRFSADEILGEVQASGHTIGRATVFRTLELLTRIGYLGRVANGERPAYTVCGTGHHHHLVCSSCGQVVRVDGCPLDDLLHDLETSTGFRIRDHRVEMAGLCPDCQH
jgi:Fur family transcriptional regulator, ferric uptake regulator